MGPGERLPRGPEQRPWQPSGDAPRLSRPSRPDVVAAWDSAWRLAREHVRPAREGTGFVSAFVDTAHDCVFLWDSVSVAAFARYAREHLPGQRTLDDLHAARHPDGFITRELRQWHGADRSHRHDPASTGPDLLAWPEWDHYLGTGDRERLAAVWPVIAGHHRWAAEHRSWPDGGMCSSGFGCGTDNIARRPEGRSTVVRPGHLTWVDATAQQLLSDQLLRARGQRAGAREGVGLDDLRLQTRDGAAGPSLTVTTPPLQVEVLGEGGRSVAVPSGTTTVEPSGPPCPELSTERDAWRAL